MTGDQVFPEVMNLVEVRRRPWVVADLRKSTLPTPEPHHLAYLISVEDDAFDEHLEVIWELEPGAREHKR